MRKGAGGPFFKAILKVLSDAIIKHQRGYLKAKDKKQAFTKQKAEVL